VSPRYAIYFSPAQTSSWWRFGASWLGRDECSNLLLEQPDSAEISRSELFAITEEPRRYGFHATLKAPFRLHKKLALTDLVTQLGSLAKQFRPVELGPMSAVRMGPFVALTPQSVDDNLSSLAAKCVTELEHFRAPLTEAEMVRRQIETLDERGQFLLKKFGYPHVLERFVLHFTLSGRISPEVADRVFDALKNPLQQLNESAPLVLDRLCLFVEDAPGLPFRRIADISLTP